jgi:outer membrane lipoprotein-sorting protein
LNGAARVRSALRFPLSAAVFLATIVASSAADTNAFLNAWFTAQTNLHTWSAAVTQTRSLRTLVQPLVSPGRVWVQFPDRFRWELGDPAQTIALRRADELRIIYPRLKRMERYPLDGKQGGPWRDAAALLEAGFPRSREELESRFRLVSLTTSNDVFRVVLQPRNAGARRLMPELRVELKTAPFALLATEMQFTDGSTMRNDFINAVANPALDGELFEFKPPADFTVVDPLRR